VRALFCDRDGTIMDDVPYLSDPAGVRLRPEAVEVMARARRAGWALVIVTNQSGVARGLITPEQLDAVNAAVLRALAARGVVVDDLRWCPHGPDDGCRCRKPRPGLILDAATGLGVDLVRSAVVGDAPRDACAGVAAGVGLNWLLGPDDGTGQVPECDGGVVRVGSWSALAEEMGLSRQVAR
jgi:D-glycero-D-manno-heptose 1,7-bisphosphate phosphatase